MAAKIEAQLNLTTVLIPGSGGEFELIVDGTLLYSKRSTGQFPDEDELVKTLGKTTQDNPLILTRHRQVKK